jgi:adenine-specific DNA methylase
MPNVLALILIEPKMLGEATHIGLNHPHRNLEAGRMSIETRFDVPLIAAMALKEKQIQQNYRPIIAVHKWFARRPGTLFRGLVLSEFSDRPLSECFFEANDFPGRMVADPFMGGGTPLLEANRVGCDVQGFDINPMAAWIVREEIEHLDLVAYREAADGLVEALEQDIGAGYVTDCPLYGDRDVPVKYFLWIKVLNCEKCSKEFDLFPGYLVAEDSRHPKNVLVCSYCGDLNEVANLEHPGKCSSCRRALIVTGPAKRNRCACPACGHVNTYPRAASGPLRHRMFAIEYYNPKRKDGHSGRFFKRPDAKDLKRAKAASARWHSLEPRFTPQQEILPGDETDRLHRWGYRHYRDLFNDRQLLGLEASCRLIVAQPDQRVRRALATNLSDLLRYQNMLCRYDTMALKSLDIFSVHGFPVGLVYCESNLLGIINGNGINVGSGGWVNIIDKYAKAKRYCEAPFEVIQKAGRKINVPIPGEWIGERLNGGRRRNVSIRCTSATTVELPPNSLDAVFTDPPYFGNVQYGELMDFCYVWLRQLVSNEAEGFDRLSTRSLEELTGNQTESRGLEEFAEGLAAVYRAMACALKPGAPLAFTFHHNRLEAYETVAVAILDAGLTCSMTLPCPAEMGGSIHIHGTGSSVVDTVFVCRTEAVFAYQQFATLRELTALVRHELDQLRNAGLKVSAGDIRCVVYGHLTHMAIWNLRSKWDVKVPTIERLRCVRAEMNSLGDFQSVIDELSEQERSIIPTLTSTGDLFEDIPDAVSI